MAGCFSPRAGEAPGLLPASFLFYPPVFITLPHSTFPLKQLTLAEKLRKLIRPRVLFELFAILGRDQFV
jgi:hypothetical protein